MTRSRQIVAFGGGGFSMEAGNPLLDDYVLGLAAAARRRAAEGLLPPDRLGRRRPLHRPLLPPLPGEPLRAVARLAVPARLRHRRRARAPARAGPRLRRRRQRHLPDGRAARAQPRRRAARGVGGGRRAVRAERRVAVLVRGGDDGLPRRVAAGAGHGPARPARTRCTTTRRRTGGRRTTSRSAAACRAATRSTTARRCTSSATRSRASSPRGRSRAPTASTRSATRSSSCRWPVDYLGAAQDVALAA